MKSLYAATTADIPADRQGGADTRLHGRSLTIARAVWAAVATFAIGIFVITLPAQINQLHSPNEAIRAALSRIGLSVDAYAAYRMAINIVVVLVFLAISMLIFARKSDDRMALIVSIVLITLGLQFPIENLSTTGTGARVLLDCLIYAGFTSFLTLFYLFPSGRFVPRWTGPLALICAAAEVPFTFFHDLGLDAYMLPDPLAWLAWLSWLGSAMFSQIYRYRFVSSPTERQQTKWVVFGLMAGIVGSLLIGVIEFVYPALNQPSSPYLLLAPAVPLCIFMLVPISFGIAIFRYRLWDIDVIINRTLVYSALTTSVIGIYVLLVGYLGTLFQTSGNLVISLAATGLVAVLFQPLRARLQRGVNRLLYGERDDPYAVISRLGQRLEATLAPAAVLPTIVQTVTEALKLPYAAIALTTTDPSTLRPFDTAQGSQAQEGPLRGLSESSGRTSDRPFDAAQDKQPTTDAGFEIAAVQGTPPVSLSSCHRVTLSYQGETVGQLLLAPRAAGEGFSPADRRLLDDLARQAGVAAHAVGLTADLQRSRERLVSAREEERRRLRRDLHDGLGPQLAGLTLKLDAARNLLHNNPPAAKALLDELRTQAQTSIADIRRLVYALRPPALDDLGLLSALREQIAQYQYDQLSVTLDAPEQLPPLPAAVEVAAYRIVLEALTNVVRHAQARNCVISLGVGHGLCLDIRDNGRGLPADRRAGVGLSSMRERAAELGGTCEIAPAPGGGTCVAAWLPWVGDLGEAPKGHPALPQALSHYIRNE